MRYLLECASCGYVISSGERKGALQKYAESVVSCSECHQKQFEITERQKSVTVETDGDGQHDLDYY